MAYDYIVYTLVELFEVTVTSCFLLLLLLFYFFYRVEDNSRVEAVSEPVEHDNHSDPQETGHVTHIGAHMKGEIAYQVHSVALHYSSRDRRRDDSQERRRDRERDSRRHGRSRKRYSNYDRRHSGRLYDREHRPHNKSQSWELRVGFACDSVFLFLLPAAFIFIIKPLSVYLTGHFTACTYCNSVIIIIIIIINMQTDVTKCITLLRIYAHSIYVH